MICYIYQILYDSITTTVLSCLSVLYGDKSIFACLRVHRELVAIPLRRAEDNRALIPASGVNADDVVDRARSAVGVFS